MRRWGALVLVVGLVLASRLFVHRAVEVELELALPDAATLREATLVFTAADEHVVRELRLSWPAGAPPSEPRTVRLAPGDYAVGARLAYAGGAERHLTRPLHVEERGTYPLDLR
jgi:hypothetical protein